MAETIAEKAEREQAEAESAEQDRQKKLDGWMDADEFVVLAPYVTLKVKDQLGGFTIRGFNEGGGVKREDIEDASLRHHLDAGLMAPVDAPEARFAAPSGTPKPGEPPNVPVTETPVASLPLDERLRLQAEAADKAEADAAKAAEGPAKPNARAARDEWVAYAVAHRAEGVSEEAAQAEADAMTKEELKAKFG